MPIPIPIPIPIPVPVPVPQPQPQPQPGPQAYYSPDGSRKVLVYPEKKDAFLHDRATPPAFDPVHLGSGVVDVQFELDTAGKLAVIVTATNNGAYHRFDPIGAPKGDVYFSQDRSRRVAVTGENRDAFLYDVADPPAFEPMYLGSDVKDVQFQKGADGKLAGVSVMLEDGALNLFDQNGKATGQIVYSPDRTRRVEVGGEEKTAYLYDTASTPAFAPVHLGSKVTGVQFQSDEQGKLVVLTLSEDGSTRAFDKNGALLDTQAGVQTGEVSAAAEGDAGAEPKSSIEKSMQDSDAYKTLKSGVRW